METLFRRHFWILHAAFLAIAAFLIAGAVNVVLGHVIQQAARSGDDAPAEVQRKAGSTDGARMRDFGAANDANIFGARREVVTENAGGGTAACTTDEDCPDGACEQGACVERSAPPGERDNAVRSELKVKLVGTAVFENPEFSLASIVEDGGGKGAVAALYSIRECEPLPPLPAVEEGEDPPPVPARPPCNRLLDVAVIREIQADHVYLYNESEKRWEYLLMGEEPEKAAAVSRKKPETKEPSDPDLGKGITKNSATSYTVKQEEIDKALGNLSSLATQARIVPAFEGGEPVGFKLFSIRPNSLYSKIGIQNGDVITRINGYEINSPDKALEVYQKLKDSKSINVDLKRRGKAMTLEYGITP